MQPYYFLFITDSFQGAGTAQQMKEGAADDSGALVLLIIMDNFQDTGAERQA